MSKYNPSEEYMHVFSNAKHAIADQRDCYNFCAGPCVLPRAVMEVAQKEIFNYRGCG